MNNMKVGDRVRFTASARRFFPEADGRKRFTVTGVRSFPGWAEADCVLSDGKVWSEAWLERIDEVTT